MSNLGWGIVIGVGGSIMVGVILWLRSYLAVIRACKR